MSGKSELEQAKALLAEALPEMEVSILGPRELWAPVDPIGTDSKLVVSLPEAHVGGRFTLLTELHNRTGISFSSDSRALTGAASYSGLTPEQILDTVQEAVDSGRLEELTLDYLDRNTSPEDKQLAVLQMESHKGRKGAAAGAVERS